jgi:hypothetical protein
VTAVSLLKYAHSTSWPHHDNQNIRRTAGTAAGSLELTRPVAMLLLLLLLVVCL